MLGKRLGDRYEVTAEIGRGGMGVVYAARDSVLEREVAIKVISPAQVDKDLEERFKREARVVAQMDHPSIVGVYDFGAEAEHLFFVMPFVRGTTMREALNQHALSVADILELGSQIASALSYSHERGIIHRDIKPENVMLVREPGAASASASGVGGYRARVADFGLALTSDEPRFTRAGVVVGTVAYLAPEQVTGAPVQGKTDVYALGVTLYEALTGQLPFPGEMHTALFRIVHEQAKPPRTIAPNLPADVDALVMQCIAKDPAQRPDANQVAHALSRASRLLQHAGSQDSSDAHAATVSIDAASVAAATSPSGSPAKREPIVGRDREIELLTARLASAMNGESQVVLLSGETGIGKTRVLDEIAAIASTRSSSAGPLLVLRASFAEEHHALPYQGFADLLASYFRGRSGAGSALSGELAEIAPELIALFPALSDIDSLRVASSSGAQTSSASRSSSQTEGDRTRAFETLARALVRIAAGRVLVLLLDDLHASAASSEALQYIALRLASGSTFILGAYTDTDIDRTHPIRKLEAGMKSSRRFTAVALQRLAREDQRALIEAFALEEPSLRGRVKSVDGPLADRLHEVTEGNPFVTREMLRSLVEAGTIAVDETGTLSFSGAEGTLSAEDLPSGPKDAIERRLERLEDAPRRILGLAALLGRSFDVRDLEALVEEEGEDDDEKHLDDILDNLVSGGFLREPREGASSSRGDDRLAFTSGVMSDVLYAAIPRRKRRKLHVLAAEQIEKRAKGKLDRVYGPLLHHYARGDVADKAIHYGLEHARKSLASLVLDEALDAAKTVLGFVEDDGGSPEQVAEVRALLGTIHRRRGHHEAAIKELELATRTLKGKEQLAAYVDLVETAWEARRAADVARWLDKAIASARACKDKATARRLLLLGTTAANLRGDAALAQSYAEQAASEDPERSSSPSRRSGTIEVAMSQVLQSLDPKEFRLAFHHDIAANIYETLTQEGDGARIVPFLARSFAAEDGGKRYRFHLRSEARFHDGRPVTAEDVRASWARQLVGRPDTILSVVLGAREVASGETTEWRGFQIVSPSELVIELESPLAVFPALVAHQALSILPADVTFGATSYREGLVGTGPFRVTRFDPGRRLELEANPDYWRPGLPRAEGVVFDFGIDDGEIARLFSRGRISVTTDLSTQRVEELRNNPTLAAGYRTRPSQATSALFLSTRHGPLVDTTLRRRIVRAIDPALLARRCFPRGPGAARSFLPPVFTGEDLSRRDPGKGTSMPPPNSPSDVAAQEVAMAKTIAADTGKKSGSMQTGLRLGLFPVFQGPQAAYARELEAMLSKTGIALEVIAASPATFETTEDSFDMILSGWVADYPDADSFLYSALHSTHGWYGRLCGLHEIDELLEKARVALDPSERQPLYARITRMLFEHAVLVPLFHNDVFAFVRPEVKGADAFASHVTHWSFDELWVD